MVALGKGILEIDESVGASRCAYRAVLRLHGAPWELTHIRRTYPKLP